MDEIAEKILSVIVSAAASGVISGVAVWFKMRRKKDDAVADGVQCLLREKIIEKHAKYVEEKHKKGVQRLSRPGRKRCGHGSV